MFRNSITPQDDPAGDFRSGEVRWMNQDHWDDLRLQEAGHNDR